MKTILISPAHSTIINFTPLNKAINEIGGNKLAAIGGLTPLDMELSNGVKPPASGTYLTGFI